jgi:hypothetical protein
MPEKQELPDPWYWSDIDLSRQLQVEVSPFHILHLVKTKTIARRKDNDDVLFELIEHQYKYAVVHLTWSSNIQTTGDYPRARLFKSWADVYSSCIMKDHEKFES